MTHSSARPVSLRSSCAPEGGRGEETRAPVSLRARGSRGRFGAAGRRRDMPRRSARERGVQRTVGNRPWSPTTCERRGGGLIERQRRAPVAFALAASKTRRGVFGASPSLECPGQCHRRGTRRPRRSTPTSSSPTPELDGGRRDERVPVCEPRRECPTSQTSEPKTGPSGHKSPQHFLAEMQHRLLTEPHGPSRRGSRRATRGERVNWKVRGYRSSSFYRSSVF